MRVVTRIELFLLLSLAAIACGSGDEPPQPPSGDESPSADDSVGENDNDNDNDNENDNDPAPAGPFARAPVAGELMITELLARPLSIEPEWLEILNTSDERLSLRELRVGTDEEPRAPLVSGGAELDPGERVLVAEFETELLAGSQVLLLDEDVAFGASDVVYLWAGDTLIATFDYRESRVEQLRGESFALSNDGVGLEPNMLENWCTSLVSGSPTPLAPNGACPLNEDTPWLEEGELVFTEILIDAIGDDTGFEWVEVRNSADGPRRFAGLEIDWDGGREFIRDESLAIGAGETRVFASGAVAPLLSGSIEIAELRLPNDEGYFGVMDRETLLGELRYSDSPLITAGRSLNLEPGVASGGLESACLTTIADAVPAGTNTGTPGAPEGGCPALMGSTPTAGDLVITEIMANPDIGPDSSEWFEVKNVTGTELQLTGLTVTSGDGAFSVVEPGVTLSPGATLLFQQVEVLNLPRDGTIEFTQDLSLDEVADSLTLRAGDEIIDEVSFEDDGVWPTKRGWSLSLDPFSIDAVENNNPRRWCYGWSSIDGWENRGTPGQENDECPFMASDAPMIESPDVYALDSVDPIEMRVTIDSSLLAEIESTPLGEEGPEHAATFTGPGLEDAGATMSLRGATSRAAIQKSFKLRLADNTFREQSVINLSKSPFDLTRIRNQLSFRLMRGVPNLSSVRTQFIHLFVNDVDYGLYTQLENLGGRYLRNHRLDERGTLFKANNFFFGAVSAQDRSDGVVSGLEIKNGSDWASLIEAIDAVNDGGVDIDDVVERHFNRENLIAWLATNYALDNVDTVNQNFYLYSPDSDPGRYYFIPWDYDGALDWYEQGVRRPRERFREGVTNWLGSPLFDRWVRKPQNLSDFVATANELVESHYARSVVDPIVDSLDSAAAPLVQSSPDSDVGNLPVGDRAVEVERLRDVSDRRIGDLSEWLERPFPVWTAVAYPGAGEVRFAWSQSFDFQGDEWTGEVVFSDGPCDVDNVGCFADEFIVATSTGHPGTSVTLTPSDIPDLDSGTYYFTVRIRDSKGNYQGSFDQFFPLSVQWP